MFSFRYAGKRITRKDFENSSFKIDHELAVTFCETEYQKYNASEWVLWFENTGDRDSRIISDICDCDTVLPFGINREDRRDMYLPKKSDLCVISMNGMVESDRYWENAGECADEYTFRSDFLYKLPNGKKSFANRGGRSSDKTMPFFDVTQNGEGYFVAIGWTGDWKAEFTEKEEGVAVKTGLKETRFYLKPHEKLRTSSVLIMKYGKDEDKYNKFRSLVREHFSHIGCTAAKKEGLLAFEFFGSTESEIMKERIEELSKHDIRFDEIWIDAGWYGKCRTNSASGWDACVGEWEINKATHPNGLKDVAECASKHGMSLMFWVEPERAKSGGSVIMEHPDWFLSTNGTANNILNLGNKEAWNYAYDILSKYIEELRISCYRQDYNVPMTAFFAAHDEKDRRGITEIKHMMGLYELWDRLLQKFPGLLIDNCASGGRRIDLETLKRSVPFFRSDYMCNNNADPEILQIENNISYYLPYNGCCTKAKGDLYAMRSSYSSGFGCMSWSRSTMEMTEEDFAVLKKSVDEYRRIRRYFSKDFHSHGADIYDPSSWTVWQYHDKDTDSGILMAFRRSGSPFDSVTVKLKGTDDHARYIYRNLDTGSAYEGDHTIRVELLNKRSCVMIEYHKEES